MSDKNQPLDRIIQQYLSKYPRHRCYVGLLFQQGKRTVVQINIPARELGDLVQSKPPTGNEPQSGKDRPEIDGHADQIKQYLLDRINRDKPWILGTLTVNIAPEMVTIEELGQGLCLIAIPSGTTFDLADGQHRQLALEILTKQRNLLENDSLGLTVILESNLKQCQLDFRDMAQAKPVDNSLLLSFSEEVGRVGITKQLEKNVLMFQGKTDQLNKSPKGKKLIYTTKYIATMVSCILTNNPNTELEYYDVEKYAQSLTQGLNYFFSECPETRNIATTRVERLTAHEIKEFKRDCLLGVSIGLQILGYLLHCTYQPYKNSFDLDKINKLVNLNWSRDNEIWHTNVVRINPKDTSKTYISFGAAAVSDAVKTAKILLDWTN